MAPVVIQPKSKSKGVTFGKQGHLFIPRYILEQLSWQLNSFIQVSCIIEPPLTLLLRPIQLNETGFTLIATTRNNPRSAGKLSLTGFTKQYLRPRVSLPLHDLEPIFLTNTDYDLALLLEPIPWQTISNGVREMQHIDKRTTGVYQLLDGRGNVLRVGEGLLRNRIQAHLQDSNIMKATAQVQFIPMEKSDARILEKVLIAQHEGRYGELPPLNRIRS